MRSRSLRGLIPLLALAAIALSARAEQMPPVMVTFGPAPTIIVGQAARLPVYVRDGVGMEGGYPLLLTARAEGTAIEVVRERMTRRDSNERQSGAMVFMVPVFGAQAGDGAVRVEVETYRCSEGRMPYPCPPLV